MWIEKQMFDHLNFDIEKKVNTYDNDKKKNKRTDAVVLDLDNIVRIDLEFVLKVWIFPILGLWGGIP